MADGTITFSTALDNEQLEKDIKRTEKEIDTLKRKIEEGKGEESFAKSQMEAARQATEEARQAVERLREELGVADEGKLASSLKDANREVASLEASLSKTEAGKSAIDEQMAQNEASIQKTKQKLGDLKALLEELEGVDTDGDMWEWHGAQREIGGVKQAIEETNATLEKQNEEQDALNDKWQGLDEKACEYAAKLEEVSARQAELAGKSSQLSEANASLKAQTQEQDRLTKKWRSTNEQTEKYIRQLERATARQKELGEEYGRTYSKAGASVSAGMEKARSGMDAFASRINTMLKRVFVFGVILKAVRAIAEALTGALAENDRFSASWENLRATVVGVANAIANLVAPALTGMVNAATAAIQTLAQTVDSIFGTNIVQAIQAARSAAEANWRQTDASKAAQKALEKQAKAAKKLAKEEEKAKKTLLSFDEINALNADDSEDAADSLGDEAGALGDAGALKPDWGALDVGKVDAKLAEIMLVLGAALMAVGAILCFSGINIPLGITLMAIGALMVYTAYKEQWGKLPREARDAINGALVITGIVLVVLGAVLAFSGVNLPLGIGMMVAGALLLWTAVGLNWDGMSGEVQDVVSVLMTALSLALLVIGAILAFSGANVPFGIALMLAGAASLSGVVAINWDRLPEEMRGVASVVMGIVGGALLVVGAILALSGVSLPLGIGLMAVGAVVLGADAALNWNAIQGHLDEVVPLIEAAVGGALLVVGAVLAFSGVNLPLGLGLMAVGAVSLGKALVENWDSLPPEVRGVIATVELAVGGAALVVGAILCFSGVNVPLGLGLLAGGAVAMGNALTDNWDEMPDGVRGVVAMVEAIVAPALLVVGAALAFSGVNLPLGLGLLAGGALALAQLATVNWDEMPDGVQGTVTTILGIVGPALLVLGIILCATGVGVPIGIACIAAGAASLVAEAAINWDFIVDKVKEIWGKIVDFWKTEIAPVFTWEWWFELFKSIFNGLVSVINDVLSTVGSAIDELAFNLGNIVGASGGEFDMPAVRVSNIPPLAQGAVIPPNRRFLAMLGDQTHGNNIETPEALMRQVVREESGTGRTEYLLEAILEALRDGSSIYVDGQVLGQVARREMGTLQRMGAL